MTLDIIKIISDIYTYSVCVSVCKSIFGINGTLIYKPFFPFFQEKGKKMRDFRLSISK